MSTLLGWFQSLRISRKLLVAFGLMLSLSVAIGVLALILLSEVTSASHELATSWLPSVAYLADMRAVLIRVRVSELEHIAEGDREAMARFEHDFDQLQSEMIRLQGLYAPLIASEAERALSIEFDRLWNDYRKAHAKVIDLSRQNRNDEALAVLRGESQQLFEEALAVLQKDVALNRNGGTVEAMRAERLRLISWVLMLAGLSFSMSLGVLLARFLGKRMSERIGQASAAARRVAAGDVEFDLPETHEDGGDEIELLIASLNRMIASQREMALLASELAKGNLDLKVPIRSSADLLGTSFERMVASLSSMVALVRSGATVLVSVAGQIDAAARDLSLGTSEQSVSASQSSEGLREVNAAVSRTAEVTTQLDQMARDGAQRATSSGEAVRETLQLMRVIEDKTAFVEQVARETHLLAINASLEAARAGQGGKGFSIIAAQVRQLADSSKQAAKDIAEIVGRSVDLANESGILIDALVPSIVETATLVQSVAGASREQAIGISQVSAGMLQVAHVSERTAIAAKQLTETAGVLQRNAQSLDELASQFRTQGEKTLRA